MTTADLFDRALLTQRRARATHSGMFLQTLARDEILERLESVNRTFTSVAVVTGFPAVWADTLPNTVVVADGTTLNLEPQKHDLVIHAMGLHVANDPVGQLIQCRNALVPDGLFMGSCFGGQTLVELRAALATAEVALTGGLSPRVSPMAEIRDLGALLQRAMLAMPVTDTLMIPVEHRDIYHLMHDLREMGETNVQASRHKTPPKRALFERAQRILIDQHPGQAGGIQSSFDLMFLSGWAPDENQPKPLRPGSVSKSLLQALEDAKDGDQD